VGKRRGGKVSKQGDRINQTTTDRKKIGLSGNTINKRNQDGIAERENTQGGQGEKKGAKISLDGHFRFGKSNF